MILALNINTLQYTIRRQGFIFVHFNGLQALWFCPSTFFLCGTKLDSAMPAASLAWHRGPVGKRGPTVILIFRRLPIGACESLPTVLLDEKVFLCCRRCGLARAAAQELIQQIKGLDCYIDGKLGNNKPSLWLWSCVLTTLLTCWKRSLSIFIS